MWQQIYHPFGNMIISTTLARPWRNAMPRS